MTDPLEKSNPTQAEYFEDIVATIRDPLLVLDAGLRVLAANRSFYKFFKVKAGDTIGRLVYDLGNRQWNIPGLRLLLETILPQKAVFNDYEVEHDFPVIGRRILQLNARRIPKPPKVTQWILLAFEDVTERIELERSLQASEQQFHAVFETASDSMLLVDKISGQVHNSNRAAQDSLGYSKRALLKKNLWELGILKDRRQFRRISIELERQGVVGLVDTTIPTSQGGDYPADITIMDRSEVIQFNIHEITERKQAEEKLSASENELRSLFAAMTDVVFVLDGEGRYLRIAPTNPINLYRLPQDMLGKAVYEVLPKDTADYMMAKIHAAIETKQTILGEYALQIDGKEIWFASSASRLSDNSVIWVAHDISERKRAEGAIHDLARFPTENPNPVMRIDRGGILLYANKAALVQLADWKLELGNQVPRVLNDPFQEVFKTGTINTVELTCGGCIFSIAIGPTPEGNDVNIYGVDITERKQAESKLKEYSEHLEEMVADRTRKLLQAQEELVRKEKLAVLGTLAGGVGHELRNPLGVISNSVYYLKMVQPEANEKIKKHHGIIEQELHNATRIVSDLLDYAREISTEPKPGSVSELVEYTLSCFPVPASIQVSLKIPADLPQVYADPLHVQQILGNLVTNACQAMNNPSLDTKAGSATTSGRCKLTISATLQKKMVAIAVKDTGTGIIPENLPKLFEPLFSTKVTGIGLGLAVSRKLAEANSGRIEVESQVGKGSTFTLYLPVRTDK
jgi:PAS domain S-box-containing protein